ncbi:MAG: radical SAM protein [Magnetococcales bacterium]|nr:radical SAM protein [Magnetococcales bacterium]MBF0322668.1 radical SAM protein [Magnetococcales bacterium]
MYALKPQLHERHRQHKRGTMRTMALDITSRCNMNCPKCYAETFRDVPEIDIDILAKTFDEAFAMGVFHYIIQGGEVLEARDRLESVLKSCHPDATYLNVVSNGWHMTADTIAWLKHLQVDKITISLDSGIEAEHDAGRLPGSYRRAIRAVDQILAAGLFVGVSTVVTHQSLYSEGFQQIHAYTKRKRVRLEVQVAEPVGKWDGRKDILITPEDASFIKELYRTTPRLPNGDVAVKRDIFDTEKDYCPAATEFMSITAAGELLPCNFLQFSLGNIKDKTLTEMRNAILPNPWFTDDHPYCIIGENHKFIDQYVTAYVDAPKPLNAYEVFGLSHSSAPFQEKI